MFKIHPSITWTILQAEVKKLLPDNKTIFLQKEDFTQLPKELKLALVASELYMKNIQSDLIREALLAGNKQFFFND